VLFLSSASPEPSIVFGLPESTWTVITAVGAVIAASVSTGVALYSLRRVDRLEHHRWLQEKRREAYVEFMSAVRTAYDVIAARGRDVEAPRVSGDFPDPDSERLVAARTAIDEAFGEVARARNILAIVGPVEMEQLVKNLIARLQLDRGYYSPTGWSDRWKDRARIFERAENAGDASLLKQLRAAYGVDAVDVDPVPYSPHIGWRRFGTVSTTRHA
jgi:hypothetical protein